MIIIRHDDTSARSGSVYAFRKPAAISNLLWSASGWVRPCSAGRPLTRPDIQKSHSR
jgi:hypothetical protein